MNGKEHEFGGASLWELAALLGGGMEKDRQKFGKDRRKGVRNGGEPMVSQAHICTECSNNSINPSGHHADLSS